MTIDTEIYTNPEKFREHLQNLQNTVIENEPTQETTQPKEEPNETPTEETPVPDTDTDAPDSTESVNEGNDESYKENKYIPKSRFNEINKRNKELEEFAATERDARIRLETQVEMLRQQFQQPEAKAPQLPELDQIDALDHEAHQVYLRKIKELESKVEQVTRSTTQQTEMLYKQNVIKVQKEIFEKNNPDYKDALEYLKSTEMNVAKHFYKSEKEAETALAQKYNAMAEAALNNQRNVAEVFYNIAKDYGYNSAAKTKQSTPKGEPNIDAINRNMAKTASVGSVNNVANNNVGAFDIKKCLRDPNNPSSGIDPAKWEQYANKRR
jgi:predicted phage tail protein